MSVTSRWIMTGAGLLAGSVAILLLVGVLAAKAPPAEAQRYFDPAFLARAAVYSRTRYLLFLLGELVSWGLLILLIARGWDRQFAGWIGQLTGPRPLLTVALEGAAFALGSAAAGLPFGLIRFYLDHQYGLSTAPLSLWLADLLRSAALDLVIGAPLLAGLFWVIQRWPYGWWAPAAAGFTLYLVASSMLGPVLIDPLFYRFTPVRDPALAAQVREMAARAGVPVQEVLEMDASRRTTRVNAYFAGFGRTRRIVLYDTLLDAYNRRHVLLVLAHELGHWRLHHIYQGIALGAAGSAAIFWLAQRLLAGAGSRPGDPGQLALLLLFLTLAAFASLPVQNLVSRTFERQADQFALDLTRDSQGMAELEERLARDNLADVSPHPLTVAVLFTHPPVLERIQAALSGG